MKLKTYSGLYENSEQAKWMLLRFISKNESNQPRNHTIRAKVFFPPKVQGSRMVFYKFIKVTCLAAHTVCCRGNSCILTLRIAKRLFLITANLNAASGLHHVQADKSMVVHLMKLHSTFTFEAAKNKSIL